jgi:uncharacterized protein YvpB
MPDTEEAKKTEDSKKEIEEKQQNPANSEEAKAKLKTYVDAVVQMCNAPGKGQSPPQNIEEYLPYLITEMANNGVLTKNDAICVFATAYVETGSFAPVTEEDGSAAISQPYGGPQFVGRGFIQITHDFNYEAFAKYSGLDAYNNPNLLNDPVIAAQSTLWFYLKGSSPPPVEYAQKGDFDNARSCINSGQPNQISACHGVPEYRWSVEKGLQVFPDEGIDPAVVGVTGVVSSTYGSSDFDSGSGGTRNLTGVHNPTSQQSALDYALGLAALGRSRELTFKALMDVATFPGLLDVDIQTSLNVTGFAEDLDGDYTIDSIDYYFGDRLEAQIVAFKPDPNAPPPQIFPGSTNPQLGQPQAGNGGGGNTVSAPAGKSEKTDGGIKLNVPYLSQLDNIYNPGGSCNATSLGMVLAYLGVQQKNPSEKDLGNEIYPQLAAQGIAGTPTFMVNTVQTYGLKANFVVAATDDEIKQWLETKKIPVVIHGDFTGPGHIIAVVGYDKNGFIVHDPWGQFLGAQSSYDNNASGAYHHHNWDWVIQFWHLNGGTWTHFIEPG